MPKLVLERPTRESVTTIRADGARVFLFPADVQGRFARARRISALLLIAFYLLLPWIKINGYPAAFLDIGGRRFHLFGSTLALQDLWLMFFFITGVGFSLFFVTALLGRVWCGWACPHTVFLDHVYRRIERWIDGDALERRALAAAPWTAAKVANRVVKHVAYVIVSAVIMHLFLAYFVSLPEVWAMVRAAPAAHWGAFAFMAVSTGLLYVNFAWFREQMCIVLCPYGRMQSALIDDNTLIIGYDARRGEPRGKRRPEAGTREQETSRGDPADRPATVAVPASAAGLEVVGAVGDCVDCARCVHVCPTGIDIRQGLQMECIGCTACIDACDDVMTRLGRRRGLIRYDSQVAFAGRRTRWARPRTVLYLVLLLIGIGAAGFALSTVKPANFGVTRMIGAPYIVDGGAVRNQFLVRVVNKRNAPAKFVVSLEHPPAGVRQVGFEAPVEIAPLGEIVQPLILQQARSGYAGPFEIVLHLADVDRTYEMRRRVEFVGPETWLLREEEEARRDRR